MLKAKYLIVIVIGTLWFSKQRIAHCIEETIEVKNTPLLLRAIRLFEYCLLVIEQITVSFETVHDNCSYFL